MYWNDFREWSGSIYALEMFAKSKISEQENYYFLRASEMRKLGNRRT